MRVISLHAAANAGGSHLVPAVHDPAAVVALAALALSGVEGVAPGRAAIVEALAALEHCGAVQFLSPLVVNGEHPAWTPFFVELMFHVSGQPLFSVVRHEVRRRASHVDAANPEHWIEICAALSGTAYEGIAGDLTRGNCPYKAFPVTFVKSSQEGPADLLADSVEAVQSALIDGLFAQPVAHVTKSGNGIVTTATDSKRATSRKSAGPKKGKAVAKKAARSK